MTRRWWQFGMEMRYGGKEFWWVQRRKRRSNQVSWCRETDSDCKCVQKANGLKALNDKEGRKDVKKRHDAASILVSCNKKRMFCVTLTMMEIGTRKERRNCNEQTSWRQKWWRHVKIYFFPEIKKNPPYSHPSKSQATLPPPSFYIFSCINGNISCQIHLIYLLISCLILAGSITLITFTVKLCASSPRSTSGARLALCLNRYNFFPGYLEDPWLWNTLSLGLEKYWLVSVPGELSRLSYQERFNTERYWWARIMRFGFGFFFERERLGGVEYIWGIFGCVRGIWHLVKDYIH